MSDAPPPPAPDPREPTDHGDDHEDIFSIPIDPLTDESPTIISRVQPTQTFLPAGGVDAAFSNSFRGRTLAHFELLEPIGVGGMAAVLRARDRQLDRFVALKILPPDMAQDPEHVKRFHQEARAAAKLDHENIARVYFCGEDQKLHFIAFEFVEGSNLRTVLERRGRLPVQESVHYMLQIATGLAHAAARGVVHRDIKPSNIIITPSGRAKLVDMGLARSLEPHDNRQLTQSGVTLGTFDYISPEQALEPRDADVRSDIYSLGCTFYHMLTGQAPVPEGTAAKKLHHHQHVAPIDPRQLNPEIPDDVAAILQRMMAKDVKDRYQRAEHLVQHLIQVAQKIGGVDASEGLLFVDAPLPSGPRKRPVLLGAIAAAVLGAFVLAVAVLPRTSSLTLPNKGRTQVGQVNVEPPGTKGNGAGPSQLKDNGPPSEKRSVTDQRELADALNEDRSLVVEVANLLELGEGGVAYHGAANRKLTIKGTSDDPRNPTVVQITCPAGKTHRAEWAGLTIDGGQVAFKNLHFKLSARATKMLIAGVLVKAGQVSFDGCVFSQTTDWEQFGSPWDQVPVASVALTGNAASRAFLPHLVMNRCFFQHGQAAVSVKGPGHVEQVNCALGSHACMFHLWGQERGRTEKADLLLRSVSAHVLDGPVFRIDRDVSCDLKVQNSIFCCPDSVQARNGPDLIRQTATHVGEVRYLGKRNAYHGLASFWAVPETDKMRVQDWASFKSYIRERGGSDPDSNVVPSKENPFKIVPTDDQDPLLAFAVNPKLPALRRLDNDTRPIGVEECAFGRLYADYPNGLPSLVPISPLKDKIIVKAGERYVDPSGTYQTSTGKNIHKTIGSAINEAEPNDIIYIVHTGDLAMESTEVLASRKVTVQPYKNMRPRLVLDSKQPAADKDAALFRLIQHCQIAFQDLEFVLRPNSGEYRSLTLVNLSGNALCQFSNCVITLDSGDHPEVRLGVAQLTDQRDTMKMPVPESRPRPDVWLKECLVRGQGDLLGVRASRPFELKLKQCLVCLGGALVHVEPTTLDMMPLDARAEIKLDRVTTWLGEPLIHLVAGKNGRGLAYTQVTASDCLFDAAETKPLIRVDGLDNEKQLKELLSWTGTSNAYCGYGKLLSQSNAGDGMSASYYADEWKRFTGESGPETLFKDKAIDPISAAMERPTYLDVVAKDFRHMTKTDVAGYGVVFDQLPMEPSAAKMESED